MQPACGVEAGRGEQVHGGQIEERAGHDRPGEQVVLGLLGVEAHLELRCAITGRHLGEPAGLVEPLREGTDGRVVGRQLSAIGKRDHDRAGGLGARRRHQQLAVALGREHLAGLGVDHGVAAVNPQPPNT